MSPFSLAAPAGKKKWVPCPVQSQCSVAGRPAVVIKAVVEWLEPLNKRQLQRLLGIANFHQRFIRDFSRIPLPLTHLTSPRLPFSSAPLPSRLSILWNNASPLRPSWLRLTSPNRSLWRWMPPIWWSGLCSPRSQMVKSIHVPFSLTISPSERNYNVGHWELLAIKLVWSGGIGWRGQRIDRRILHIHRLLNT